MERFCEVVVGRDAPVVVKPSFASTLKFGDYLIDVDGDIYLVFDTQAEIDDSRGLLDISHAYQYVIDEDDSFEAVVNDLREDCGLRKLSIEESIVLGYRETEEGE